MNIVATPITSWLMVCRPWLIPLPRLALFGPANSHAPTKPLTSQPALLPKSGLANHDRVERSPSGPPRSARDFAEDGIPEFDVSTLGFEEWITRYSYFLAEITRSSSNSTAVA